MPSNGVTIKSPHKGVNKQQAWGERDADFALDALNVLPYDLEGRQRVTQRPGTSLLTSDVLAGGVSMLAQVTVPIDPTGSTPTDLVFGDHYTRADGPPNPASVFYQSPYNLMADATYPGLNNSTTYWAGGGTPAWRVSSNRMIPALNATVGICTAILSGGNPDGLWDYSTYPEFNAYGGLQNFTNTYTLKATVKTAQTNTNLQAGIGFLTRVNVTDRSFANNQNAVWVVMNRHHVTAYKGNSTSLASHTFAVQLTNAEHALELRVSPTGEYTVYVDSVLRLTFTPASTSYPNSEVGLISTDSTTGDYVDDFQVYGLIRKAVYRDTKIVAVGGTSVYVGTTKTLPLATGGSAVVTGAFRPQFAYSAGKGYIVDGTNLLKIDLVTKAMETYSATAGSAPTGCSLAALYRDRLVLAAPLTSPHLFYLSRVGTHTDWDYSQTDPAAAFAGNASTAGHIGDPITALIPAGDDVLYIGGDHTLHAMRGDPADGGSIDLVSDAIGILGPNAWCKAPDGTIYFVGTGGLFRMSGGPPENVSEGKWSEFFRSIDRAANYITLSWDRDHKGCYIFVTPVSGGTATHLWFDARSEGLWPIQFPDDWGPLSALVYDGDAATDRVTLLGSRVGYVLKMADTDGGDAGGAITSYVYVGPFTDNDLSEQTAEWFDVILGEPASFHTAADWNVSVAVQSGQTPYEAFASPKRTVTRTYDGVSGRQPRWRQRTRGNSFVVKLSNDQTNRTWAFEKIIGMFLPSGTVRRT